MCFDRLPTVALNSSILNTECTILNTKFISLNTNCSRCRLQRRSSYWLGGGDRWQPEVRTQKPFPISSPRCTFLYLSSPCFGADFGLLWGRREDLGVWPVRPTVAGHSPLQVHWTPAERLRARVHEPSEPLAVHEGVICDVANCNRNAIFSRNLLLKMQKVCGIAPDK